MQCFNNNSQSLAVEDDTWLGTAGRVNLMEGASQSVRNIKIWIVTHNVICSH